MRLTLRTLLAYLDDTLEPLEIKTIGQKVAESDTAQELIARIKQVTRRRRITTPPATGPHSFEPNMVADYLDNELSAEQVAELEKICLESDVHLAEVASCHQILTLVLGEPAVVPPTAKERMYALVRGREAIPFRKAATDTHAAAPTSEDADADEMFLLGLPFYRRGSWLRWALPIVAILLFAIGGIALWQSIHGVPNAKQIARASDRKDGEPANQEKAPINAEPKDGKNATPVQAPTGTNPPTNPPEVKKQPQTANPSEQTQRPEVKNDGSNPQQKAESSAVPGKLEAVPNKTAETSPSDRTAPPSDQRVVVGKYSIPDYNSPSLLVQLKDTKEGWSRLKPNAPVSTGDQLVSLPGYASEVRLNCGLHLLLRGHVREFTPPEAAAMYYLQESAIVLHAPKKGCDADLTLQRGRLYLSNHKSNEPKPLLVRLRFEKRVWDVTLHPEAEMVVDLIKSRSAGEPVSQLSLFLLGGNAGIVLEGEKYPEMTVPGWAQILWFSGNPSVFNRQQISKEDLTFAKNTLFPINPTANTEQAQSMKRALNAIRDRMTVDKSPLVALKESLETDKFFEHQLALYCLAAMDEIKDLLDVLGRADQFHFPDRNTAIFALRRWLDHDAGQDARLYDKKNNKGILLSEMGYTPTEADQFILLLADPTHEQVFSSKDYYEEMGNDLASDKVAIAELARWRLTSLAIGMFQVDLPKLKNFNAARPRSERVPAMEEVLKKVKDGQLPPSESRNKPGAGGQPPNPPKGSGINPQQKQKR